MEATLRLAQFLLLLTGTVQVTTGLPLETLNLRPIIGVLAQTLTDDIVKNGLDQQNFTYISASYVKHMESAGARVVPILPYQNDAYYENMGQSLNGFIFPGGVVALNKSSGYGVAGRKLYDHVVAANERGVHLPLWGTCLGYEMITYLAADNTNWLTPCEAYNIAMPITLQSGHEDSEMFQQMPEKLKKLLTEEKLAVNFHNFCITRQNISSSGLSKYFKLLATGVDDNGLEFAALLQHRTFPIFGSHFHPEKNLFEWATDAKHDSIPHSPNAIRIGQYFGNFFVNQARRNKQSFATVEEEEAALIYNTPPYYTGNISGFTQSYLFKFQ